MRIGGYFVRTGTTEPDEFSGMGANTVSFGMHGDDTFVNYTTREVWLVGGSGNDTYGVSTDGVTMIQDAGNSPNDSLVFLASDSDVDQIYEIDGRHLALNKSTESAIIVLIDWRAPENRIETFHASDGTLTFDQFASAVVSAPNWLGNVSSDLLGSDFTTYMHDTVDQIAAQAQAYEIAPPVEVTRDEAAAIARLYEAALDRLPDTSGLNHWIDAREDGTTVRDIALQFTASDEFTTRYGTSLDDATFIDLMYKNVMGRSADDPGRAFWLDAMSKGTDRADILVSFANSAENVANTQAALAGLSEVYDGYWTL